MKKLAAFILIIMLSAIYSSHVFSKNATEGDAVETETVAEEPSNIDDKQEDHFSHSLITSIITGVSASLTASIIFLFVLFNLKPSIELSKYIADQTTGNDHRYAFKIINKTRSRIFDVKVQVLLIDPVRVHGGPVNSVKEIKLLKDEFFEIGRFYRKDNDAHYALRFGTDQNLRDLWSGSTQYLRVNIISRHALSGFSKVESFKFDTKGSIVSGKHEFGTGMEVKAIA